MAVSWCWACPDQALLCSRNWCVLFWICKTPPLLWKQQGKPHSFQVFETWSPVPAHGQAFLSKKEQVQWSPLLWDNLLNSNLSSTLYFRYFCLNPPPIPAYLGSGLQRFRKKGQCCLFLQCYMRSLCPSGIHCCSVKPDSLKVFPTAFIFQLVFYSNSAVMPDLAFGQNPQYLLASIRKSRTGGLKWKTAD